MSRWVENILVCLSFVWADWCWKSTGVVSGSDIYHMNELFDVCLCHYPRRNSLKGDMILHA